MFDSSGSFAIALFAGIVITKDIVIPLIVAFGITALILIGAIESETHFIENGVTEISRITSDILRK